MRTRRLLPTAALLAFVLLTVAKAPAFAGSPDPAKAVTAADLQKVLGGKWSVNSPEPGVLICEETGGYRVVNVYLSPADGKSVAEFVPAYREQGETVDDVAGVGDAAMYRPQYGEATVEKKDAKSGERLWLSVSVHNVDDPAARKKLAVELVKLAAGKL